MFNLSQKLANQISAGSKNFKKEKNAESTPAAPLISSAFKEQKQLGKLNTLEDKPKNNLVLTDKPLVSDSIPKVTSPSVKTVVNNPGVKVNRKMAELSYKRNTGLVDSDGLAYTNTDDVLLLGKLGYTIDEDSYLFLPRGQEREGLYSYIEKNAGVPKSVTQCVDEGKAFSSEYLKSMDYSVPEGYEIKGDLCCPVEKTGAVEDTSPSMSLSPGSLQTTHSPINMQASTLGQTTPVDQSAKNKALLAAGKSFATDQMIGSIPSAIGGAADIARGTFTAGRIADKIRTGANVLEGAGHIGAGELSARQADSPSTANLDRALSYASSVLPVVTKNPLVGALSYAGNTLYDVANAGNEYHKNIPSAPPSMGRVPEQKFNINLKQQPVPDFRLTQPNLKENMPSSGVRIAKQGEVKINKKAAYGGTVVNFPQRQIPPISMPDRLGSLVFGKNYIPSPINGESMYDAMLRSGRNKDMLDISQKAFANNPLFHRLGLKNSPITSLLGLGDYMTQGKLSSMLSPFTGGNVYKANSNIQEMLRNPSIMSQFKQASSKQPMLPGMNSWAKKQPFNYAEDAYKRGRIPKHVRDAIVSGRAAETYRPKFKEMLDNIRNASQNK